MEKVKVVKVSGKLKVVPLDNNKAKYGYVQFPRDLRVEGKVFEVDELNWVADSYWKATGTIREYRKPKPLKYSFYASIRYNSSYDYEILRTVTDYYLGLGFIEERVRFIYGDRIIVLKFNGTKKEFESAYASLGYRLSGYILCKYYILLNKSY